MTSYSLAKRRTYVFCTLREVPLRYFYRPRDGNVFTSVCQEFCPRGEGGGWISQHVIGRQPHRQTPPRQTPPLRQTPPSTKMATEAGGTHPTGIHSCSGRVLTHIIQIVIQLSKLKKRSSVTCHSAESWTLRLKHSLLTKIHVLN